VNDPVRLLSDLRVATPDPRRAARIRARCHAGLAERQPRPLRRLERAAGVWQPLLAGLGSLYFTESLWLALRFAGVL
jgi:hypothetical protein